MESFDWSDWSLIHLQVDCRWTSPISSRISHFVHDRSTVDNMGTSKVLFTPLVVFAACLTALVLPV